MALILSQPTARVCRPVRLRLLFGVRWKPIVWSQEDHYAQWLGYPTREGSLPLEGSRLTLSEHPGETFVVTKTFSCEEDAQRLGFKESPVESR